MDMRSTAPPDQPPTGHLPWFSLAGRRTQGQRIAFGHWSTLSLAQPQRRPQLIEGTLGLDTGCLWGGRLTAARLGPTPGQFELFSVPGEDRRPD